MKTLALFGARGFVGQAIFDALKKTDFIVTPVTRESFELNLGKEFDVVINAAMPAARFKAKNNPEWDFTETVEKTQLIFKNTKFKKFVQISSVSARCQLDTVYGRHKAEAEAIVNDGKTLIVRLGPMFGPTLTKGVLIDMLEGKKVFINGSSRYAFAPLEFVAGWIVRNLDKSGVHEVGAKNAISLETLAKEIGLTISFEGDIDHQDIQKPEADFPDVKRVIDFMKERKK